MAGRPRALTPADERQLVGSSPSASSPRKAAQPRASSSLSQPHSLHRSLSATTRPLHRIEDPSVLAGFFKVDTRANGEVNDLVPERHAHGVAIDLALPWVTTTPVDDPPVVQLIRAPDDVAVSPAVICVPQVSQNAAMPVRPSP